MPDTNIATLHREVQAVRLTPDSETVLRQLGLLRDFAGTWAGRGFNLIGRPDAQGQQNVYLQLNQTRERLKIDPIGSAIPNRGFGQDDIELFGLSYLQTISDEATGGAMHLEPGLWVTQPQTQYPAEAPPPNGQIVARMASIPHGNAILAQGNATPFSGPPVLQTAGAQYAFSAFPSFNSTPFAAATPTVPAVVNAAGTSEKLNALAAGVPPFTPYDLTIPEGAGNPRTPFATSPPDPALPGDIDGVAMQDVVNDPILLLRRVVQRQIDEGHSFEGTVLNIASQASVNFRTLPDAPTSVVQTVAVTNGAGGIENILFLEGGEPVGAKGPNANTAMVYATFWITKVKHPQRPTFMQLQYAQMVVLNFPILTLLPRVVSIGWPHVSVATLRKTFN